MKRVLKSFLFSTIALFGSAQIIEGFSFGNDPTTLVVAAVVFGVVNSFLKPILKLITLPFNLMTFGLFSVLINVALLYLTVQIVPGLSVEAFYFPGMEIKLPFEYANLVVPPLNIPTVGALLLTSIVISIFMIALGIIFDSK